MVQNRNIKNDAAVAENEAKKFLSSEEALEGSGVFGRYQIYMCLVLQYSAIVGAGCFAMGNFGKLFPTYFCEGWPPEKEDFSDTHTVSFECMVVHNCTNRTVLSRDFLSFTDEWFLVCEKSGYLGIILLSSAIGRILGAIIGGHIGDIFGRKAVLYPSQFGLCIIGTLSTACTVWYALAICSFFTGLCYGIGETSVFVLIMEMTSGKYRWITNSTLQWCIQYPMVALIGYLTGNWRMYLIIINVIFAPLLVFYMIFMESPRFLIYKEQFDRAAKTLSDMASDRWNYTRLADVHPEQLSMIPTQTTDPKDPRFPGPWTLFRHGRAKLTATLIIAMLYRGIVANLFITDTSDDAGNPFLNVGLYGIIRIWVPVVIVLADWKFSKFGRRMCFLISQGFLMLLMVVEVILSFWEGAETASRAVGLIGASIAASGAWMSIAQYMIESYPTAIRGIAYGWIECFDGVGTLITPYVQILKLTWEQLPRVLMIVLAVLTLISGFFVLPETKFQPLKDKIYDNSTSDEVEEDEGKDARNGDIDLTEGETV